MEDKIKEAMQLLVNNGYIVRKMSDSMNKDADECSKMQEIGKDKDCFGCSCSMCVIQ